MKILLETPRLIITPPTLDKIELVYALDADPDVMRYIGNGQTRSKLESREWYEKSITHFEKYGFSFGLVFEKESGDFVGRAGISYPAYNDNQPDIEMGYRLHKKYWNKGYATELAESLILWGFQNFSFEKLLGFVQPGNSGSRHVLEKAGMHFVCLDKYESEEVLRYEILRNEGLNYNLIANEFANMRNEFYSEKKYLDIFTSYLKPSASILDIGCGSGHPIASYLISQGFKVTGIDSSKELLKIASTKCPQMKTYYGDIRTIPLDEKFDAIVEWWCLFHIPKQDHVAIIKRFSHWLKPGGILHFTSGDTEYEAKDKAMLDQELSFYSLSPVHYRQALEENGFEILLCENDQETHIAWIAIKR